MESGSQKTERIAEEEEHVRQPAPVRFWYVIATGFISIFIAMGAGYAYVHHVQQQTQQANAKAAAAEQQQRTASLKVTCQLVDSMRDFYISLDTPGATKVADAWGSLRSIIGCETLKGGK